MRRLTFGLAMAASLVLAACSNGDPTDPSDDASEDDYALVMFGGAGASLESSLGPQGARPFDGRTGAMALPPALQLTDAQRTAIEGLRAAFRAEHQASLDALRAIFEEARAAREDGATREEVHTILEEGRDLAAALRDDVEELHQAILDVLTDAQRAWLAAHPRRPPSGLPPRGGRGGR
jgi:hypothetical protein